MTQTDTPADTLHDRIRLPFHFDADKLKNEIQNMGIGDFTFYDVLPLRAPAHTVDTSLPPPPPADDYADGSWTNWMDTSFLKNAPYLTSVIDTFRENTTVTLVRVLRLASGSVVREHTDPTLGLQIHKSVIRLTIPVIREEGVKFFLNDTTVDMKPGECWYLRLTDRHKVVNSSSSDRINITIDMIPNDWIRGIIEKEDKELNSKV
mgnify:CR=1 FL=1